MCIDVCSCEYRPLSKCHYWKSLQLIRVYVQKQIRQASARHNLQGPQKFTYGWKLCCGAACLRCTRFCRSDCSWKAIRRTCGTGRHIYCFQGWRYYSREQREAGEIIGREILLFIQQVLSSADHLYIWFDRVHFYWWSAERSKGSWWNSMILDLTR